MCTNEKLFVDEFEDEAEVLEEEESLEVVGRTRAQRRRKDFAKARRKSRLDRELFGHVDRRNPFVCYYDNLHQYSKNKISSKERKSIYGMIDDEKPLRVSDQRRLDSLMDQVS